MVNYSKGEVITLGIVLPLLSTFAVFCRLYTRLKKRDDGIRLKLDDYLICTGLLGAWGLGICLVIGAVAGNYGQHSLLVPGQEVAENHLSVEDRHFEWTIFLMETLTFGLIKTSILLFYRRIFSPKPAFNILSWCMIGIVFCWTISFFFARLFWCRPISANWGTRQQLFTQCLDTYAINRWYVVSDIIVDGMILSLPIPMVLRLHMTPRKKIAVLGIFLLGTLSVAAGIARTKYMFISLAEGHTDPDVAYLLIPILLWTIVEACLAVVAACLPTLGPLFAGFSLDSVMDSVRSVISLRSFGSNGSNRSNGLHRSYRGHRVGSDANMDTSQQELNPPGAIASEAYAAKKEMPLSKLPKPEPIAVVAPERV